MRWNEIVTIDEALNLGSNMTHVEDLRLPGAKDHTGRKHPALLVMTKDEGAVIYNWADGNIEQWRELYAKVEATMDRSVQSDITQICLFRNGYIINSRLGDGAWTGHRTKHTDDIVTILKGLKERGLAENSTPIWFGNWASGTGESAGSLGKLLAHHAKPLTRLTLYHGTSSYRAEEILKQGLIPVERSQRIWTKTHKQTPVHRAESIYLTASLDQAQFYANKAVNVDKRRSKHDEGEIVPVILTCTLGTKDMEKLVADDDHIANNGGSPEDWRASLSGMGQVAYKGSLPPSRIRVYKRG